MLRPGIPRTFRLALRRRDRTRVEVSDELAHHIEAMTDALIARGVAPDEARAEAIGRLGPLDELQDRLVHAAEWREDRMHAREWLESVAQDVRLAVRALRRSPGFAITAVATLALGVGATTTMFSAVDGVLLRPLPYPEPDRLMAVFQQNRLKQERTEASPGNFLDWRERSRSFTHLASAEPFGLDLETPNGPESIMTWLVSDGFLQALAARPMLGRVPEPGEFVAGRERVVVLSHALWVARFAADPAVIGRAISADREPATVIGVMPPEFKIPYDGADVAIWAPKVFRPDDRENRGSTFYHVIGRLRPGVTPAGAEAELDDISRRLEREYPRTNSNIEAAVVPLAESIVGRVRRGLLVLFGAVGLVLLIVCANLANLLLARASRRGRELAVRVALGAGRGRVLRFLLAESAVIAMLGGVLGVILAHWGVTLVRVLGPPDLPRIDALRLDARAVVFALGTAVATIVLFGLAPALGASRSQAREWLRGGSRGATSDRARNRLRRLLVVTEVALSVVLLIGAGLLVRSLTLLLDTKPGYRTKNVLAVSVQAWGDYPRPDQKVAYARDAMARLAVLPGVEVVGAASALPLAASIGKGFASYTVIGAPPVAGADQPTVRTTLVAGDYFSAVGIPLRSGRLFTAADGDAAPPVVLVNESFARRHWPAGDAVGKRILIGFMRRPIEREVVGVVGDVRHAGLDDAPAPGLYIPHAQEPSGAITFVVRAAGDPAMLLPAVRRELFALNPAMPLYAMATMDALLDESLRSRRFTLTLLGTFSLAALVLAAMGIYGVMSQETAERTREIGVRVALGARPDDVLGMVMRRSAMMIATGIVIGLAGAAGLTRLLGGMLYEVQPLDVGTFLAVMALIVVVAFIATSLPAYRASRTNPLEALRSD
jgi:putative ABC transport system permease protein